MGLFDYHITFTLNFWTFILIIVYIAALVGGYYLIATQVKLVKKEVWNIWDRVKCGIFAFFFANGVSIIITMMITFTTGKNYANTGVFIVVPLLFCLIFISIYPLLDFLYMAKGNPAMTPLQEPFKKLISLVPGKAQYLMAILLYGLFFVLPFYLLLVILNIPLIVVWISWGLLFPMSIVTFYGAKGYIAGLVNSYLQIPTPARSSFLLYDDSKRASKEFFQTPVQRIMTGLMLFLYFWTAYSMYSTLQNVNPESTSTGFNTMSYAFTVYIVLFLGIWGYFSRFWGRKIKFKTMDILFAASLIAAVGVNVLTNFSIVNADILSSTFQEWDITNVLNQVWVINSYGERVGIYRQLAPAAIIEETVLVIAISYYFFEKKREFMMDTVYAEVTKAGNAFNPVPVFNQARSTIAHQREHAFDTLLTLYGRIPHKAGFDLKDPKLKDPLLDSLCDKNPYAEQIGLKIVQMYIEGYPKEIIPLLDEGLRSENDEKVETILKALNYNEIEQLIPFIDLIYLHSLSLLKHPNSSIQLGITKLLYKISEVPDFSDKFLVVDHIQEEIDLGSDSTFKLSKIIHYLSNILETTGNWELAAESLNLLLVIQEKINKNLIDVNQYINHPSLLIRKVAAKGLGQSLISRIENASIEELIQYIEHPSSEIKIAAIKALSTNPDIDISQLPKESLFTLLLSQDIDVRENASKFLAFLWLKDPSVYSISSIIDLFQSNEDDDEIRLTIANLLYSLSEFSQVQYNKCKELELMSSFYISLLYQENSSFVVIGQKSLYNLAKYDLIGILDKLLIQKETESFIRKGNIAQSIIKISELNPKDVVEFLIRKINLGNGNIGKISDERIEVENIQNIIENSVSSLEGLVKKYPEFFDFKVCMDAWTNATETKIKKDLASIIASLAIHDSDAIKPFIPTIIKQMDSADSNLKLKLAKMILNVAEKVPELFPLSVMEKMIEDDDGSIRELGLKFTPIFYKKYPKETVAMVLSGLKDSEWNVKTTAADMLSYFKESLSVPSIQKQILSLLDDPVKWSRLKALELIENAALKGNNPPFLSLDKILTMLKDQSYQEEDFQSALAKLVVAWGAYDYDNTFPHIIDLLQHPSTKVKDVVITGLSKLSLKIPVKLMVPQLLQYLSDETPIDLQESISLALKKLVKYESEALKVRVISLLRIRCEMSQNKIICKCLADLEH